MPCIDTHGLSGVSNYIDTCILETCERPLALFYLAWCQATHPADIMQFLNGEQRGVDVNDVGCSTCYDAIRMCDPSSGPPTYVGRNRSKA